MPSYRRTTAVKLKKVGEDSAAYVPSQKALHVLNPTARLLLEYLEEPAGRQELLLMLSEATDGTHEQIETDLHATLASFVELELIEEI